MTELINNSAKILLCSGGTGGHLYPAQALASQLKMHLPEAEIAFIGGGLSSNRCFNKDVFIYREITCSPLLSKNFFKLIKGARGLIKGYKESLTFLKEFSPDIVIGFGSYHTAAPILAAKFLKIPILLHEADSVPGAANRWLSYLAQNAAVQFPEAGYHFKCPAVEIEFPLREGFSKESVCKQTAMDYYGFDENKRVLLVFGGSQGAKFINELLKSSIKALSDMSLQVIHLTGDEASVETIQAYYTQHAIKACVKSFEKQMQMAWKIADAFIGRSGASTIAEALVFEVPGILIPYPFATNQHQDKNADFFVSKVFGGIKFNESELRSDLLIQALEKLFRQENLDNFKKAMFAYKRNVNRKPFYQFVIETLEGAI